jgi:hypothetical protein
MANNDNNQKNDDEFVPEAAIVIKLRSESQNSMIAALAKRITDMALTQENFNNYAKLGVITFDMIGFTALLSSKDFPEYFWNLIMDQQVSANKKDAGAPRIKFPGTKKWAQIQKQMTEMEKNYMPDMDKPRGAIAAKVVRLSKTELTKMYPDVFPNIPQLKPFSQVETIRWFLRYRNANLEPDEAVIFLDIYEAITEWELIESKIKNYIHQRAVRAILALNQKYVPKVPAFWVTWGKQMRLNCSYGQQHDALTKCAGRVTGVKIPVATEAQKIKKPVKIT